VPSHEDVANEAGFDEKAVFAAVALAWTNRCFLGHSGASSRGSRGCPCLRRGLGQIARARHGHRRGRQDSIGRQRSRRPSECAGDRPGDATLLPGFIDAHVHLSGESGPEWYHDWFDNIMRFPAEQSLYGAHYAKVTLEAGITTVRDLGSADYIALGLRNAIEAGMIPGPRMLVSNYAIGSTGGHADQDPVPPQRMAVAGPIQGVCNGPEECRAAVRYQVKYGANVIKFMPSGGVLSLADPVDNVQLTQEEMDAHRFRGSQGGVARWRPIVMATGRRRWPSSRESIRSSMAPSCRTTRCRR